jgi:hypothetical protein
VVNRMCGLWALTLHKSNFCGEFRVVTLIQLVSLKTPSMKVIAIFLNVP